MKRRLLIVITLALASSCIQAVTPFEILGLKEGASQEDIKKTLNALTTKWYPDRYKNTTPEERARYFKLLKLTEGPETPTRIWQAIKAASKQLLPQEAKISAQTGELSETEKFLTDILQQCDQILQEIEKKRKEYPGISKYEEIKGKVENLKKRIQDPEFRASGTDVGELVGEFGRIKEELQALQTTSTTQTDAEIQSFLKKCNDLLKLDFYTQDERTRLQKLIDEVSRSKNITRANKIALNNFIDAAEDHFQFDVEKETIEQTNEVANFTKKCEELKRNSYGMEKRGSEEILSAITKLIDKVTEQNSIKKEDQEQFVKIQNITKYYQFESQYKEYYQKLKNLAGISPELNKEMDDLIKNISTHKEFGISQENMKRFDTIKEKIEKQEKLGESFKTATNILSNRLNTIEGVDVYLPEYRKRSDVIVATAGKSGVSQQLLDEAQKLNAEIEQLKQRLLSWDFKQVKGTLESWIQVFTTTIPDRLKNIDYQDKNFFSHQKEQLNKLINLAYRYAGEESFGPNITKLKKRIKPLEANVRTFEEFIDACTKIYDNASREKRASLKKELAALVEPFKAYDFTDEGAEVDLENAKKKLSNLEAEKPTPRATVSAREIPSSRETIQAITVFNQQLTALTKTLGH